MNLLFPTLLLLGAIAVLLRWILTETEPSLFESGASLTILASLLLFTCLPYIFEPGLWNILIAIIFLVSISYLVARGIGGMLYGRH